jgi:DNA repair protein SbcD/Mre11
MKYAQYPEIQAELCEARFRALESLVARANAEHCQLLTVGGDLFDRLGVPRADVARAARILGGFEGAVVAVLPGNHDYFEAREGSLWSHFEEAASGRTLLLKECRVYPLAEYGLEGVELHAAPCRDKHSSTHALGWMAGQPRPDGTLRIGLAHGSLEGLSFDREGCYYPMTRKDLEAARLDLWLLGHVHAPFPAQADAASRVFYPGTPEPDGFDCAHEGRAWLLDLSEGGALRAEAVSCGSYRFEHARLELRALEDLRTYARRTPEAEARRTLLKLHLSGRLPSAEYAELAAAVRELEKGFLHVKPYLDGVGVRIAPEDIEREYVRDSFGHRLLSELALREEDREALQIAHDLLSGREAPPA